MFYEPRVADICRVGVPMQLWTLPTVHLVMDLDKLDIVPQLDYPLCEAEVTQSFPWAARWCGCGRGVLSVRPHARHICDSSSGLVAWLLCW